MVSDKLLVQYKRVFSKQQSLQLSFQYSHVSAAIDCGAPEAPLNGTVEFKDTHFMATAHYKCDACHAMKGYETRVCKRSGLWSKTTPECRPANGEQV